ncbi:MAG: LTA synthase family protein [Deltaproteobacteria bacterium]|nr:LTA synthase family protein [Deltaproteobacteria bacterium]
MARDLGRASCGREAGLLATLLATPILLRALWIAEADGALAVSDLRGFLSDGAVGLVWFALVITAARVSRLLAVALAVVWVGLSFANDEWVRVMGAPGSLLDLGYLGDITFVGGSAVEMTQPWLFAAALLVSVAAAWACPRPTRAAHALAALLLATGLFGFHPWTVERQAVANWRQRNFIQWNVEGVLARASAAAPAAVVDPHAAMLALDPELAADLDGRSLQPDMGRPRNVLLLVLESVSGVHVDRFAAAHGRSPVAVMPRLDTLAAGGLAYDRFFTLQRKTNRGLYAILCGELPNLAGGLPKMSAYPEVGGRRCLPRILRNAGFATAFAQAAPLGFMLKGQFMPRAGFERVHGREWFDHAYARSVWGVDDRAFFERSLDLIEQLEAGDAPWFLTLLNVGTHHPYVLPEDFDPDEPSRFVRALAYLDSALGAFVDRLEEAGVFDDTLVMVVSDESMGIPGLFVDPWDKAVSQNWGLLAVLAPGVTPARIDAPFSQIDVPLSILDALGLGDHGRELYGRSVLRDYDRPRRLYFANSNLHAAGALDRDGALLMCLDDFARCRKWAPQGARSFGIDAVERPWVAETDDFIRTMVHSSVQTVTTDSAPREFELVGESRVLLDRTGQGEVIHGGQYVDLRAGDWLEVELEVAATGSGEGAPRGLLTHVLKQHDPPAPYVTKVLLPAGQTLRLHYSFAPDQAVTDVQCQSMGELIAGESVVLDFRRARMLVHRSGVPPGPGLHVITRAIEATR